MERMCDAAAADELEFEAVAVAKTAAIKSCRRETTTATVAPTPSCSLPTPPTATAASEVEPTTTTLQIKEEIKDEDDDDEEAEMTAQMKLNEEDKMQGGVEKADEQSERYDEKEQTAATIKTPPPPATSMSDTTLKTSLPWDFIANDELCRSCGKPHTELYELFENEQKRRRHSTSQQSGNNSDDDDESNSRRIVKSNNGNSHSNNNDDGDGEAGDVSSIRRDPRAIARAAIATKTTAKQQQQQLQKHQRQQSEEQSQSHTQATQPSQMDNILQEMQIWHLRIKPNDGLPQRICPKCTAQFYIIGKFRRKCLKVQIRLRSMLREVEQQQQVFLATAAKDARDTRADTSPARQLDIGNELMNKQHYTTVVQPLSEVELFETNWNVASEATNSGMLIEGEEMLVDEPTINAAGANDDNKDDESDNDAEGDDDEDEEDDADEDEDEEEEDVELTSAMCIDVTPNVVAAVKALDSRPGCLRSKTTMLATSKHSSSSGVDQESQQVSKDSYKSTSHMKRKRTRKLTTATAAQEAHTLTRSSFVADSTDNQDDYYDPLEEEAMSTSKVEIISIENLKNIEHFTNNTTTTNTTTTAPPPNYKAATPQRTKTTTTAANSKQKSPELTSKSIKKPNKANPQKDCKTTTETQSVTKHQTTNAAAANNTEAFLLLHSRDVPTNNVKPHKTTTKTGRIEAESPTAPAALVAHSNSQNAAATRVADNLTPTTLLKLNEEGMKAFVSKAALKEYDSSPSTFAADDDDDCGGGDVNVDPQHAPLEQTQSKTADKNDSFDNEHKAMEDNPEEMLIIPYAQKRRKKCRRLMQSKSTEEMDIQEEEVEGELLVGLEELTSFSALDNHEITSVNTDTLPIRECSVRLYKLNDASKKSNLITTATATTTSNTPMTLMQDPQTSSAAATNEIMDNAFENVIDAAAPAEANQQALHHTKEQKPTVAAEAAAVDEDEDDDDENMPILKKIKLMKAARQEALQLKRRVSSHWKTKAEMKAVNEDPLSFRKPSLRRQMKLEKYALMSKQLFDTQRAAANIGNQMETGVNLIDAENDTDQVENAARKANVRFADEEEAIASEDLIDNIKVETLVEQPTMSLSLPSTTGSSTYTITKELSKECGGGGGGGQKTSPLKMVLRKSRYHEKLRLKRNLRANLLKLRQHNTAMATNLKCKQMQEAANAEGNHGGAGVSNAPAAAAVSITHIDLAAMVTDREAMQPPPVAKIDKLLATNFDLPTTNEALRESSMIVIPTDGDKSNAALEAATKITTTTKTEEATSGVETSLEQILSQRAAEPKLIVASNNKQGSVVLHASKTSAYGIGVNEHLQELPVSSAATSSTHANELELAFETFEQQPPPIHQSNQLKSEEQDELIVRVPLAVLTQDFQRMHFTHTDQNVEAGRGSATELPCRSSDTQAVTAVTTNWIAPENLQPQRSDYALATETQTAFASETIQLHHHHHQHQLPATAADDATADFANSKPSHETSAACSLNESDQSEFYGFGNDSDPRPTTAYDANDSFIPEKHSTMISSQINDYINEFQTHCLEADEKSPPHFSHDSELLNNDKNSTNLQTLQPTRGCSSHLANNGGLVVDNYVDNTLNGLLDEIQEQNLFSPSTTPLVTMESEDFHHHSSYSPLSSESSEQTPRSHQDYMKNSLCDLSPGPTVNPSHIIDATTQNSYTNAQLQQQQHQLQQQQQQQQQHQHQLLHQQQQLQQQQQHHQQQQQQQQQHSYNNYVECFTEDSTQSELIGFQNDIPCFENIELNSSTPRHNSTPPPPPPPQNAATAAVVQQVQLANTPTRTPNCSLQAAADQTPHPGANLKLPHKHIETGNVHYLGLGNETDLCQSLNTDSMGLVCTTGTGVQMHTPTLKSASGQMQEIPYERETISSESSDNSREYAVDSATLHFTQIFQDMPLHQQQQQPQEAQQGMSSTLQSCELRKETSNVLKTTSSPNVATSKKSAILAKYAASNNTSGVTRNLFSKKLEPATLQLPPTPKLQYVTLPPQPQHSTLSLSTQDPNNTTGLNTTQLLAAPHSTLHHHNQEMLNLGPTKYTLYTEVLPQDLQWHTTPNNMPDQQTTTTTYYINAADLNQSNLISTTTIAMQPLIHSHAAAGGAGTGGISLGSAGADLNTMTNLTLLPTQLSTGQPTATLMQSQSNSGGDKRSMDANENYMDNGGMQNQSIMIVFPQEYINDPTSGVSALYNTAAGNQLTLAPLQQTYSTIVPPPPPPPPPPQQQQQQQQQVQLNNATMMPTTLQSNATPPQTMLNNSATVPVQVSAAAATAAANRAATPTISAPHPSRHAAASSPLQPAKINLTCRFCHKRPKFTNNLDYSNHIIEMHPGENPFNCPHCPLLFTRRAQRQQHIVEVHGALRFNCAQCGQSFCAQRTLDLHLQRAHVHNDAAGQNKKAVQLQQQQQQQKVDVTASCSQAREGQKAHYEAAAATTKTTTNTTNWHERLHATTGNSATEQHASLEDVATTPFQAASATDEDDSENSSTADNSQLATESSTVQKPPHRILGCPDCDDSFDDLANQEPHTHQLLHSSHQQLHHTTPQTGNSSGSTSNLCTMPSPEQTEPDSTSTTTLRQFRKQRQSSKSPIEQPERVLRSAHSCVFCEERFTNEVALRKHHQTAHGNQTTLPFVCSMCKRGFRMRTALQRHMETHDSVGRPYECSICLVRFPRPSQLTLHKLTVHFLRKPHACNICGKQFGTESALKTHEKFHGEKKMCCDDCPKKFFLLKDLRKHRRVHTGEHFYKCDICPMSFVHYKRLIAHIKTHIPLGMCIEEDPPSLQRDREQREQEQLQLAAAESADQLNDAAAFDDMPSPEIHQVQRSS